MNLIDRLFGRKKQDGPNPSKGWIGDPSARLQVDLAEGSICGVGLGGAAEKLSRLGPSASHMVNGEETCLTYSAQGLVLIIDNAGRLEGVDITVLAEREMAAFAGDWTCAGERVAISSATTPAEIIAIMGEPDDSRLDRDMPAYLIYWRGGGLIEFDWGGKNLECVCIERR